MSRSITGPGLTCCRCGQAVQSTLDGVCSYCWAKVQAGEHRATVAVSRLATLERAVIEAAVAEHKADNAWDEMCRTNEYGPMRGILSTACEVATENRIKATAALIEARGEGERTK